MKSMLYLLAATVAATACLATPGLAAPKNTTMHDRRAAFYAARLPWHGGYYNTQAGAPVALVVPPVANTQTSWGWGVGSTQMKPIYHQYHRSYQGYGGGYGYGYGLRPTPSWPSHTDQHGIYYIRAPY